MSIRLYEYMKNKYESTKPIRGRAVDTRPWNDRRRDAELIVQTRRVMDGVVTYGARLYGTTVFEVDPKGMLTFRCDGWVSPTTVKFLELVMRQLDLGGSCRRFNNIWIHLRRDMVDKHFWLRVPRSDTLDLSYDSETGKYITPEQTVVKRTTDREKMKELRAKVKGFRQYYRSLLKLSDGLVTAQFKADHMVGLQDVPSWQRGVYIPLVLDGKNEPGMASTHSYIKPSMMRGGTFDIVFTALCEGREENYPPLLAWFATCCNMVGTGQREQVVFKNGVGGASSTYHIDARQVDYLVGEVLKTVGDAYTYTRVVVYEPTKDDSDRT